MPFMWGESGLPAEAAGDLMNSCVIVGVADVEKGLKKTPRSAPTKANLTTFRREVAIVASTD